jgi:hypothetical protein
MANTIAGPGKTGLVKNTVDIQDFAIVYNTAPKEAQAPAERASSLFPKKRSRLEKLGPALLVPTGPGILFVAIQGTKLNEL